METKNKIKFILIFLLIVLLRGLDLFSTYVHTPKLTHEWNPLVSVLGASWLGLILVQAVLVLLIGVLMYFYFSRKTFLVFPPGLTLNDYIYYFFYEKPKTNKIKLIEIPKSGRRLLEFNGYVFMLVGISVSLFAITNNMLIIFKANFYMDFIFFFGDLFFPLLYACITIFSIFGFFFHEYHGYKKKMAESGHPIPKIDWTL